MFDCSVYRQKYSQSKKISNQVWPSTSRRAHIFIETALNIFEKTHKYFTESFFRKSSLDTVTFHTC